MSAPYHKSGKFLKILFLGVIFVALVLVISAQKEQSGVNARIQEAITYSQSPVADPQKKLQPDLPELLLVQQNSLKSALPPHIITPQVLGALVGGFEPEDVQKVIVEYVVEQGDTLSFLSKKFNVSINTIVWANDLTQTSKLKPGTTLIVPPVTGIIHHVKSGDTISQIAQNYKAKADEIRSFNGLSEDADIYVGDIVIVPNGTIPPKPQIANTAPSLTPLAKNYFISPVAIPYRRTQGLHWYNAVDMTRGQCGDPIYAAAGGKVLKVQLTSSVSRWAYGGAGNNISILHSNGVVTTYGHVSVSFVLPGDDVLPGDKIALMGGQPGTPGAGLSTGCHLHFGVVGAANPFAK